MAPPTFSVHRKSGLGEGVLHFGVKTSAAHSCGGIPFDTGTAFTLGTDGLEASVAVGDRIRRAGRTVKGSLRREAKHTMAVGIDDRAKKVVLRTTSRVLGWEIWIDCEKDAS